MMRSCAALRGVEHVAQPRTDVLLVALRHASFNK
jgi:hypothetical protein